MEQNMINQYIKAYEKVMKAIDLLDEMEIKYPKKLEKELKHIAWNVISDWYDSYEPHAYRRREDLFNVYKIVVTPEWFSIKFDSDYFENWHHQDSDIIYNNTFILGFHGGSWGEGLDVETPYWRRPHKIFTKWFDVPAVQTFSPYDRMKFEMEAKIKEISNEYDKDAEKVIRLLNQAVKLM